MQNDGEQTLGPRSRRRRLKERHGSARRIVTGFVLCTALFLSGFLVGLRDKGPAPLITEPSYAGIFQVTEPQKDEAAVVAAAKAPVSSAGPVPVPAEDILSTIKWPAEGRIVREPGWLFSLTLDEWVYLPGVDILVEPGGPVKASLSGVVKSISHDAVLGNILVLEHESGLETTYGRLSVVLPAMGEQVTQGETVGSAGPDTLYFKLARGADPLDARERLARAR